MALPLYAFTTLDGREWALVARSAVGEGQKGLESRAQLVIFATASGGPSEVWIALDKNLKVVPLTTAMKEPYWQYRDILFDSAWLQAQYAKAVRRTRGEFSS